MRFNKALYIKDHMCGNKLIDEVFLGQLYLQDIETRVIEHLHKCNKLDECFAIRVNDRTSSQGTGYFIIQERYLLGR